MSLGSINTTMKKYIKSPLDTPKAPEIEEESFMEDLSVDVSQMALQPGEDIMADFGGFLDNRKKEKNMARNTMMSQIDGLVTSLDSDLSKIMEAKESARKNKLKDKAYALESMRKQEE